MVDEGDAVLSALEPEIWSVELNRPRVLNAIHPEMAREICTLLYRAVDEGARAVVISGRGRAFCSGFDLNYVWPADSAGTAAVIESLQELSRTIFRLPVPVVAAVRSYALGAGFELALICDLVVASTDSIFALPEVGADLTVTGAGTSILPSIVGYHRAKELVFCGTRIDGAAACDMGLVNRLVDPDSLMSETLTLCRELRSQGGDGLRIAKAALNGALELDVAHALLMESTQAVAAHRLIAEKARDHDVD